MYIQVLEFIGKRLRPVELRLLAKWFFRVKRKVICLEDTRKYEIDPISDLGLKLLIDKEYEPEMTKVINMMLKEGDYFIDLGANEGYFSILAGKLCGCSGKVFAIEPQRRLWNVILNNSIQNELINIQLLPIGIGSAKGKQPLHLYPTINSGASSFSDSLNFKISFSWLRKFLYGTQIALIISLDNIKEIFPKPVKLIKIDIEGFEYEALKGATISLKEKLFENILIETHPEALKALGQSEEDIDIILNRYGYGKKTISSNLNLYTIK